MTSAHRARCPATHAKAPTLMIDANEYCTPKQAIRRIHMFEEVDLLWMEEPAGPRDAVGLRKVSEAVRAAVATGENLDSHDFANLIRGEAVDIVQISCETGGITGALQIAELAYAHNLPVTMNNSPGRHMAHLAVAVPHHIMMESSTADATRRSCTTPGWKTAKSSSATRQARGSSSTRTGSPASTRSQTPQVHGIGVYRRSTGSWIDG